MMRDEFGALPVIASREDFRGHVWGVRTDDVVFGDAIAARHYVVHFGAVAVVALDDDDRLLVIQQYRHPVAARTWEVPAGLLDVPGEDPLDTAKRELAEEAGYRAANWSVLCDYANTPGGSSEAIRIYCARGLEQLTERPRTNEAEEQDMPVEFVPLDDVCDAVMQGTISNTSIVVGTLAAMQARSHDWRTLKPSDAPWPLREHLASHDRIFRC